LTRSPGGATPTDGGQPEHYGRLHRKLASGAFAVTAEAVPPRGATLTRLRRRAGQLRDWVDAANVTDGQSAMVRLATWAACLTLQQEGVEAVMQLQCRDRNRIALQADLLGASAMKIPNVLLLTGDHPRFGDQPDAKPVFDLDSIQLIWMARTMRDKKVLLSQRELSVAPRWLIGAVENPFAAPQQFRAERLGKKVAAGAQFVQTQFVFDIPVFDRWMAQVRDLGLTERCYVLPGVGPITSLRALEFMLRELPGLHIPDEVERRLRGVPQDRVEAEGMAVCVETVQQLREIAGVSGVHLMVSGRDEIVPEILYRAGIRQRDSGPGPDSTAPESDPASLVQTSPQGEQS
jgi:methylenetetrahydrofolate reductase (NADPH)